MHDRRVPCEIIHYPVVFRIRAYDFPGFLQDRIELQQRLSCVVEFILAAIDVQQGIGGRLQRFEDRVFESLLVRIPFGPHSMLE